MKKMKNGLLKGAVLGMGIVLLLLAGCSNEPKEPKVEKETHNATSNQFKNHLMFNSLVYKLSNLAKGKSSHDFFTYYSKLLNIYFFLD